MVHAQKNKEANHTKPVKNSIKKTLYKIDIKNTIKRKYADKQN